MERDKYLNPEEAKELGLIDNILSRPLSNVQQQSNRKDENGNSK